MDLLNVQLDQLSAGLSVPTSAPGKPAGKSRAVFGSAGFKEKGLQHILLVWILLAGLKYQNKDQAAFGQSLPAGAAGKLLGWFKASAYWKGSRW